MAGIIKTIRIITERQNRHSETMILQVRQHPAKPAAWLVLLALGLGLVTLSFPGLATLYYAFPASAVVRDISDGHRAKSVSENVLHDAWTRLKVASLYEPMKRTLKNDQATLLLRLYERRLSDRKTGEAKQFLEDARRSVISALSSAPGDTNLWYLLAELRMRQKHVDDRVRTYLVMSYLTGAREGWMAHRRLAFALRHWPYLNQQTRNFANQDIRLLWEHRGFRKELVQLFTSFPQDQQQIILQGVKGVGGALEDFKKLAKQQGWKGYQRMPR